LLQEISGYTGLFLISASLGIPAIMIAYYLNNKEVKAQ